MREAIERRETVAVYGDYDVDGITSACLVTSYLRSCGLECIPYIPDRLEEGYGLNSAALDSVKAQGATLVITCLLYTSGTRDYNGAGTDVIARAIEQGEARPWDFALKLLFTAVTLSAGFKGGEMVPTFFIGATLGLSLIHIYLR